MSIMAFAGMFVLCAFVNGESITVCVFVHFVKAFNILLCPYLYFGTKPEPLLVVLLRAHPFTFYYSRLCLLLPNPRFHL